MAKKKLNVLFYFSLPIKDVKQTDLEVTVKMLQEPLYPEADKKK